MNDPRIEKLADLIADYSIAVKEGEHVLIEPFGTAPLPFVKELIKKIYKRGAFPHISIEDESIRRELLSGCYKKQLERWAEYDLYRMKMMDAWVGIRSPENINELSDVPSQKMADYRNLYAKPVHLEQRVKNTRWLAMNYPTRSMAERSSMSLEAFEDFYFRVCTLDYAKLSEEMKKLAAFMEQTEAVRITGPNTDLRFSIKDIPVIVCDGQINLPDGEVFTAPLRDSVNGRITFNTPSVFQGKTYEDISFTVKDGKIVEATGSDPEGINSILDTDEGARFFGEFAIGVNPVITHPMKDTLFDEKITGSIHITPGKAYDDAFNGNVSAIHWDLVLLQTDEYGGGALYFDDTLVRENGLFVLPELKGLNP
jgi:aminopeptidase